MSVPYLRFSRDPRGYEKTYLIYTGRRHGKPVSHLLYCFRTPPNVRVGRSALDEEAIRLLEALHPEIDFDWPQILKSQPPPAPPPEEHPRRQRRAAPAPAGRGERLPKERKGQQRSVPVIAEIAAHPPAAAPPEPKADVEDRVGPGQSPHPVAAIVGAEEFARLRARHAELLVRIAERPVDEAVREAMRLEAEALDPDRWVTEAEARQGVQEFDARSAQLATRLGPRRRRRRGGRRRRRPDEPSGAASSAPAGEAGSVSDDPQNGNDESPDA